MSDRELEIDEAWLLSCGWTQIGNTFYMPESMAPPHVDAPILFWVRVDGMIYIAGSQWASKPDAKRGQLIDLIAAMGLEVSES